MYQNSLLRVIARCKVGLKLFNVIRSWLKRNWKGNQCDQNVIQKI